jgi:predicted nucleic acid-binding protein
MPLLLDTNILIDYFRERQAAVLLIEGQAGKPATSVCTVMELIAGASSRGEERRIERLGDILSVLPVTSPIARAAGQHVKHYRRSHGLDDLDALIAATAEHHRLALATRNVKHFPMFAKLKAPY